MKLSTRLTISYLALVLLGMGIVTPLAWLAVERLYLDMQSASLLVQAEDLAAQVAGLSPSEAGISSGDFSSYAQTMNIHPGVHSRLVSPQGALLIDPLGGSITLNDPAMASANPAEQVSAEELMLRSEIVQAREGQPATAVREVVGTGGRRALYAAAPVPAGGSEPPQVVYLATPLPDTRWSSLPLVMRAQFIGSILVVGLLAWGAGLLLARRIASPLAALAQAAGAVSTGNLAQPAPEDSGIVELSLLGNAFNRMTASLRRSEQARNAFIADVNHELRTPLTVIKGTIETLQDGAIDDLEAREPFLDSMNHETDRLIRLVNDLLVLTRADADALNLHLEPLDLAELAHRRVRHWQAAARPRQVTITLLADPSQSFQIPGDPDRLSQVIDNLLDNALRYSPPGGEIQIKLSSVAGQMTCRVSDQGPGIPAAHLPFIFERFYRADPSRDRAQGGSGLGLAIVKGLVAAHGGQVSVESIEGQGTTISFWLPAD